MIYKLKFRELIKNKSKLKGHNINKNKQKTFILYSNNDKINWILFREIIVRAHYHFQLDPILFLTDAIGFEDCDSSSSELNPYNPTFNILSKIDLDWSKERFVHNELKGISFCVWWDELKDISSDRTNMLLYTSNREELKELIKYSEDENREIVIIYLNDTKNKDRLELQKNIELLENFECWELKWNSKILKIWEDKNVYSIISEKLNIKKHKKIRKLRNKIFTIMNSYYRNEIIPSYINDEDRYENPGTDIDKIIAVYK